MARKDPTAADLRRDAQDARVRRCLALIALYEEMLDSHLASDAFDVELVKRMLAVQVPASNRGGDAGASGGR